MTIDSTKVKGITYYRERNTVKENGKIKRIYLNYIGNKKKLVLNYRRCNTCKSWLPLDNEFFPWKNETKGILGYRCKACCMEYRYYIGPDAYRERNGLKLFVRH